MAVVSLTGRDSIVIDDRELFDLADGDAVTITFPNNIAEVKTGKNKNALYSDNATGFQSEVAVRLIRGSSDDKYLQSRLKEQEVDFPLFELMEAQFVKRTGDGNGNILKDTYQLRGGIFMKRPEAKTNAEGDTEQSVVVYNLKFRDGDRKLT